MWILGSWMTACMVKSCSFGLPRVPFVNCCQFMYLVISLLVLRAGCGIWLYQFLIIAYLFTFQRAVCREWQRIPLDFIRHQVRSVRRGDRKRNWLRWSVFLIAGFDFDIILKVWLFDWSTCRNEIIFVWLWLFMHWKMIICKRWDISSLSKSLNYRKKWHQS